MHGDEIRTIDWNVTARFNHPYVKVFQEERELTVMLLVDISASEVFGSGKQLKKEVIAEICAVIAFSATQNNDKIGAILFTDKMELYIPPKKGKKHILRIIRELIEFKPSSKKTDISNAIRYFNNMIKKRSIAFLVSDFLDSDFENALKIANKKHDMVALRVFDEREKNLPDIGYIQLEDAEKEIKKWINSSNKKNRIKYHNNAIGREHLILEIFKRANVDFTNIDIQEGYIKPLMHLFNRR